MKSDKIHESEQRAIRYVVRNFHLIRCFDPSDCGHKVDDAVTTILREMNDAEGEDLSVGEEALSRALSDVEKLCSQNRKLLAVLHDLPFRIRRNFASVKTDEVAQFVLEHVHNAVKKIGGELSENAEKED